MTERKPPKLLWTSSARFERDWSSLDSRKRSAFVKQLDKFKEDCRAADAGRFPQFRPGLRVHAIQGSRNPVTYSMTWAMDWSDGRATFLIEIGPDFLHVTWLRIGGHEIYN